MMVQRFLARRVTRADWPARFVQIPIALERGDRDLERRRGFNLAQSTEEFELDHLGRPRIERLQPRESLIDAQQPLVHFHRLPVAFPKRKLRLATAALVATIATRMVH